ncbi:MAG: hypothetical protein ORN24_06725 [Burkholderiales bacterium]|nr:hypothetical protein [Burkholderiales bacterium]
MAGETFSSYVSLIPNGTTVIYRVLDTCTGTATNRNDNILFTSTDNVDSVLYSAGNLHIESQQIVANSLLANVYYVWGNVPTKNAQAQITLLKAMPKK